MMHAYTGLMHLQYYTSLLMHLPFYIGQNSKPKPKKWNMVANYKKFSPCEI